MSTNTGGQAFPGPHWSEGETGMTLLDWMAGQEAIGDEELCAGICEHFAGPKPSGNWQSNSAEWYAWEARWRAGVKYMRAAAMLAEKARREADLSGDADKMVPDHSPDAGKMVWKESPNMSCAIVCETQFSGHHSDNENVMAYGGYLAAESVPEEAKALIIRAPKLEAENKELVEALEALLDCISETRGKNASVSVMNARAILAKHKGAA